MVSTLTVNEINATPRNAFFGNLLGIESKTKSKNDEMLVCSDEPRIFDLAVNP